MLLREFADVGLTDRLADACQSLPKSAGQAPDYAHFFSNRHVVQSGAMCVFSESFCSKNDRADTGQVQWRGGVSHGTPCSPSFTQCVFRKILPVLSAGHFAGKAPCRRAEGLSRWVLPEAWVVLGGCVGHAPVKHRPPQNTRKVFNNASSCMRHGQLTAGSLRKL